MDSVKEETRWLLDTMILVTARMGTATSDPPVGWALYFLTR